MSIKITQIPTAIHSNPPIPTPTPRSLLPRGDPASLLVLGRPQQGPSQAGRALHSSFVRGRRVVSGGLPLSCNLRRLREVDRRGAGDSGDGESGKKWQNFGISLGHLGWNSRVCRLCFYAENSWTFHDKQSKFASNRVFRETQMDLRDRTLGSVCVWWF